MADRDLALVLKARDEASQTMGRFAGQLDGLEKRGRGLGSSLSAGFGAALGPITALAGPVGLLGLAGGLVAVGKAAADAQQVHQQLNAVLASTAGVAGVTKEAAEGLADSLSRITPFEDEAILSGENMLLTFTNIGKDIFPQATEAMLDMSQALGQDLKSSAIQLGKALNDPIGGVTALRRVGVQLTDSQEELIKKMVAAGDVMGAQKIILQELQTEFGGSAKAAGETFAGKLAILKTQLGNVAEAIGTALLPGLTELATKAAAWAVDAIPKVEDFMTKMGAIGGIIGSLITGTGFDQLYTKLTATFGKDTADKIAAVVDPLAHLRDDVLPRVAEKAGQVAKAVGETMRDAFNDATKAVEDHKIAQVALIGVFSGLIGVLGAAGLAGAVRTMTGVLGGLAAAFANVVFVAQGLLAFGPEFVTVFAPVTATAIGVGAAFTGLGLILGALITDFGGFRTTIVALGEQVHNILGILIKNTIDKGLADLKRWLDFFKLVGDGVSAGLGAIGKTIGEFFDKLGTLANEVWSKAVEIGANIVEGIKAGISNEWSGLTRSFSGLLDGLKNVAIVVLKSLSPSRVFAEIGETIPEGLAQGIAKGAPAVEKELESLIQRTILSGAAWEKWREGMKALLAEGNLQEVIANFEDLGKTGKETLDEIVAMYGELANAARQKAREMEAEAERQKQKALARAEELGQAIRQALTGGGGENVLELIGRGMEAFAKAEWIKSLEAQINKVALQIQAAIAQGLDPSDIISGAKTLFEAYQNAIKQTADTAVAEMNRIKQAGADLKASIEHNIKAHMDALKAGAIFTPGQTEAWERATFGATVGEMRGAADRALAIAGTAAARQRMMATQARRDRAITEVRQQRLAIGESLAVRLGLSPEAFRRWEMGEEQPSEAPQGLGGGPEITVLFEALYRLLTGGLTVEMEGERVGRIVGRQQADRGALLAQMGGFS